MIDVRVQNAIKTLPDKAWSPAYNRDGLPRRGAWVAEITGLLDLSAWPEGSRVIVRRQRPHPAPRSGSATATITGPPPSSPTPGTAGQARNGPTWKSVTTHARAEDAIRVGKDTGMANLPCHAVAANAAWLELALAAADLLTWTRALCLKETGLARTDPSTLRYRILHVGALIADTARRRHLKIDQDWPWAGDLATAFSRLRTAFT